MTFSKKVIVAIDLNNFKEIEELIEKTKAHVFGIKLGYEFFLNFGIEGYKKIQEKNINIFLDLKLHDIPNTVKNGLRAIMNLNPYFTTVHISGGDEMLKAAISNKGKTKLLVVTALTHLDNKQINKYYKRNDAKVLVEEYISFAMENQLDGIVCSPHEIKLAKELSDNKLIIVTPGIRMIKDNYNDQKRVMGPKEAVNLGANYLVIGRPITSSNNPTEAIKNINLEIEKE